MNCESVQEQLVAYLDDEVSADERNVLGAHIAGCPDCQREMADLWRMQSRLGRAIKAEAAAVEAPAVAWAVLSARLAREQQAIHPALAQNGQHAARSGQRDTVSGDTRPMKRRTIFTALASLGFAAAMVAIFVYAFFIAPNRGDGFQPAAPGGDGGPVEDLPPDVEPPAEEEPAEERAFKPVSPMRWPGNLTEISTEGPEGTYVFTNPDEGTYLIMVQSPPGDAGAGRSALGEVLSAGGLDTSDATQSEWDMATAYVTVLTNLPDEAVALFGEGLAVAFTPYQITEVPGSFYTGTGAIGIEKGLMVSEDRYNGNDQFIVVNQRPADPAEEMALRAGSIALLNGAYGTASGGLSGTARLGQSSFFEGRDVLVLGGGGGGGGGGPEDSGPRDYPDSIAYEDGQMLTLVLDGVRIELLSNVPMEDLLAAVESLKPGVDPSLTENSAPPTSSPAGLLNAGVHPQWDIDVENTYEAVPSDINHSQTLFGYSVDQQRILTEGRWFGQDRFAVLMVYPTGYLAMSSGEQIPVGDTLGILRQVPGGEIQLVVGDRMEAAAMLQAGDVHIMGAGGGSWSSDENEPPAPPERIAYDSAQVLTWDVSGQLVTLLSNLTQEEMVTLAEAISLRAEYILVQPSTGIYIRVQALDFVPLAPTYLPDGLGFPIIDQTDPYTFLIQYTNFDGNEVFLQLWEEADDGSGIGPGGGEAIDLRGWEAAIQTGTSGLFSVTYGPDTVEFPYDNGTHLEIVTDSGVRINLLTNLDRDETIRIAEGLVGPAE